MQGRNKKGERERECRVNGSNANNKMCFEFRAPSSTSPPSPRRISNPLTCPPRTPTEGTSTEDFANTTGSTELLSQPIQPLPRQYKWSTEDRSIKLHKSTNTTSTEANTNPPLPKRDIHKERVYNKVVYLNHKPNPFPTK